MLKKITNKAELEELLSQSTTPVLVDFYADWCPPCKMLLPVLDKIEEKHGEEFAIAKINVDQNPDLASEFSVKSIPALFYFLNNEQKDKSVGFLDEATLVAKLRSLK